MGSKYFQVFFNITKKVKIEYVDVILRFPIEYFNYRLLQTDKIYLYLQDFFCTPPFSSSVFC